MAKKCILKILLVDEADEKTCKEIEKDIVSESEIFLRLIPWAKEIGKIVVSEASC